MYSLIGLDKVYEITIEIKAPKKEIMEERKPFEADLATIKTIIIKQIISIISETEVIWPKSNTSQ